MKIRITDDALRDLENGIDFYNRIRDGLGVYFYDSLCSDIDSLILYAGIHAKLDNCHFTPATRFPYVIWYLVRSSVIIVVAVLDGRMEPEAARNELARRLKDG